MLLAHILRMPQLGAALSKLVMNSPLKRAFTEVFFTCANCSNYVAQLAFAVVSKQQNHLLTGAVAQARFLDAQHTRSYLGQLHLRTSDTFPDKQQMFAAGYLEAWMTAGRIRWAPGWGLERSAADLSLEPCITPAAKVMQHASY